MSTLEKRHGDTHFANLPYGYYVLGVILFYSFFLIFMRRVIISRYTKVSPWKNRILQSIRTASPCFHLPLLSVFLFVPFVHHYSFIAHISVYIKRLGRLSYVLLLLNVVLTLRPFTPLIGYNYLDLIPLHKWLSRYISVLGIIHGIGFIIKWSLDKSVSLWGKVTQFYNFVGVLIFMLLVVLLITSVRPWRRYSYKSFYVIHQISQWAMTFLTPIHARPRVTIPYFAMLLFLCIWRGVSYCYHSRYVTVVQRIKEEDSLTYVKLNRDSLQDWAPGSHLRVSKYRKINPLYWLMPTHPFTIASLSDDQQIDLVIRENGSPYIEVGEYTIVDAYSTVPSSLLYDSQRVAIVIGGSGISFGLGVFKHLQTRNLEYLKCIWLVRNKSDLQVLNHLNVDLNDLEIFVTRSLPQDDNQVQKNQVNGNSEFDDIDFELENMDESGALLTNDSKLPSLIHLGKKLDWQVDLAQFIESNTLQNTWLVCCGPESLLKDGEQYAQLNCCNFVKEFYNL